MKEIDNRVRVTKMFIRQALLTLLKEKPLQNITVRELCQACRHQSRYFLYPLSRYL